MKLNILDVQVSQREVEIPAACPRCKTGLTAVGSRRHYFRKDICYRAPGTGGVEVDYDTGYEDCDGDDGVPNRVECRACGQVLAEGSYKEAES